MLQFVSLEVAVLILGGLIVLFEAFVDETYKDYVVWLGIAGLAIVFGMTFLTVPAHPISANASGYLTFYKTDALALFFKRFALATTILVLILAREYRTVLRSYVYGATRNAGLGEFISIPIFTCCGLMWMASAADFTLIFVSVEVVTISFYVLVSYTRRNFASLEAGVKYLVLGALSTGFLVYGISWFFGLTGETNLDRIAAALQNLRRAEVPILFATLLVLVGLGFKIAAVPFQFWVPDVYQGAPTPVTAFLSVGSKAAGFVVLLRVVEMLLQVGYLREKVLWLLTLLAAATLIYGNLAAIPQTNLKRLLGYSSIAHAGYLLVGVASIGAVASGKAICFYLVAYLLMTLLSFLVLIVVTNVTGSDEIAHFSGLGKRSPFLAFGLLVAMASLAGVPFTAGFFGKFFIFEAAIQQHLYGLVAIGVVTVAAGFYYYLKVVRAMYWLEPAQTSAIPVSGLTNGTVAVLVALIFLLGVYPQPVFRLLEGSLTARVAAARTASR